MYIVSVRRVSHTLCVHILPLVVSMRICIHAQQGGMYCVCAKVNVAGCARTRYHQFISTAYRILHLARGVCVREWY